MTECMEWGFGTNKEDMGKANMGQSVRVVGKNRI